MTPPTVKPPEQPGSATGKTDEAPAPRAQGSAPAAGGASVQSTIAAYRSLRSVSSAIVRAIERLEPKPTHLLLIADASELEGLNEYRAFMQAVQLYIGELRAIASELEAIPEDLAASMSVTAGVAALAELGAAVRCALGVAASIPEKRRPALVQRLTSLSQAVAKLSDSLLTDPKAAQRLLKGAALDRLMPDGLLVHLTVSAAGAQVYERAHLFGSSRKHSGGVVVTYALYASDGAVRGGEALDALKVYQQEEIPA